MVPTGNREEDLRRLDAAVLHEKRLAEGICANGCGPMDKLNDYEATCPACGFHYGSNTPI